MIARTTLADLERDGLLDGYRPYAPLGITTHVDVEIAQEATCDACGHQGCDYRGFVHSGSYLAFAVCPHCDCAMEF